MKNLKMWKTSALTIGLLSFLSGGLLLFYQSLPLNFVFTILGLLFITTGVITFVDYFKSDFLKSNSIIIDGVLDIFIGFALFVSINSSLSMVFMIIAFWILFKGIINISTGINFKKIDLESWWTNLITGIIGIIVGVLLIGNSNLANFYILMLTSVYLISSGITYLSLFLDIDKIQKLNKQKSYKKI